MTERDILAVEPDLIRAGEGPRWLAVSRPGSVLNIGVFGYAEDDARRKFSASLARWATFAADGTNAQ